MSQQVTLDLCTPVTMSSNPSEDPLFSLCLFLSGTCIRR
nr:unknown [Zea mays]